MVPITRRRAVQAAALSLAVVAAAAIAGSARLRAPFSAAWIAFRDPARVAPRDPPACDDESALPLSLEQPEVPGDFDLATGEDRADGGLEAIATLTLTDLPLPVTKRTMRFVSWFSADEKGRKAFSDRFRRAGRYREHIERVLRDAGLPEDLLWLVAIESGFNPQAVSPKGAAGLFQFMPETGAKYGLGISAEVDDRKSITRSTAAGTAHLDDLFARYRSWELALAAYNYGHERLDASIARLESLRGPRAAGRPATLKELAELRLIPKETADFVPQIHAFAIVAANRGLFGLDELDPVAPLDLAELAVPGGTRLRTIAGAAGISVAVLRDYNPDLLADRVPAGADHLVNLPADRVAQAVGAFPVLAAREASEAAAADGGSVIAAADTGPDAGPPAPATARWTLPNGITVQRTASEAAEVTLEARVEVLEPGRVGLRPTGASFSTAPVVVPAAALDAGVRRLADAIGALVDDGGEASLELRRRIAAARREAHEQAPYGSSWIALSEALFPPAHPRAGAILAGFTRAASDVLFVEHEPRWALRPTVAITGGAVERERVEAAARPLGELSFGAGPPIAAHPTEERRAATEAAPTPRLLVGWIGPPAGDAAEGPTRLALMILAHGTIGRGPRALGIEKRVAARVRGALELGARGSVAAIEAVPAVPHDVSVVLTELDRVIAGLAAEGPTGPELSAAKALTRAGVQRERLRAAPDARAKEGLHAALERMLQAAEAASAEDVRAATRKVFAREHRVIVTTSPR